MCTDGLKIYKFKRQKQHEKQESIVLKLTEKAIPIKTDDFEIEELASRIKYESKSVIRFLTRDNRDILYQFDKDDDEEVHYISEVNVRNLLVSKGQYKLALNEGDEGEFEQLI